MDVLSQELQDLLLVGVFDPVTKQHYKACVIGTKGDWPYLAKVAKFTRTFQSGAKKGGTKRHGNGKPTGGICHLCLAGQDEFPYEEIATQSPRWLRTVGVSMPWHEPPAFIERLCHDQADPAFFSWRSLAWSPLRHRQGLCGEYSESLFTIKSSRKDTRIEMAMAERALLFFAERRRYSHTSRRSHLI
jgi:hypothetical protein